MDVQFPPWSVASLDGSIGRRNIHLSNGHLRVLKGKAEEVCFLQTKQASFVADQLLRCSSRLLSLPWVGIVLSRRLLLRLL